MFERLYIYVCNGTCLKSSFWQQSPTYLSSFHLINWQQVLSKFVYIYIYIHVSKLNYETMKTINMNDIVAKSIARVFSHLKSYVTISSHINKKI